jgi:hypothetical protein
MGERGGDRDRDRALAQDVEIVAGADSYGPMDGQQVKGRTASARTHGDDTERGTATGGRKSTIELFTSVVRGSSALAR